MTAAVSATADIDYFSDETTEKKPGFLTSLFHSAAGFGMDTVKKAAGLVYDFTKANAIFVFVGADILLNGGVLTQQLVVGATKMVFGAATDLTLSAGGGLWDLVTGVFSSGTPASVPVPEVTIPADQSFWDVFGMFGSAPVPGGGGW